MSTIYAAVIEWPDNLASNPALILASTPEERDRQIAAEIRGVAGALTFPGWRDAIEDGDTWPQMVDAIDEYTGDAVTVTPYKREV